MTDRSLILQTIAFLALTNPRVAGILLRALLAPVQAEPTE